MRKLLVSLVLIWGISCYSQELNCNVVVNAQLTGNENFQIFRTLETQLNEFVNKTKWTDKPFGNQEKITCNMVINITSQNNDAFGATIQVQSSRPVYGSTYTTPVYNVNDKDFSFRYVEFQNFVFNKNQYESNLVSVIAFHVYMILGMDADTFERNGGDTYFQQAQIIVNYSQQDGFKGWKVEDGLQSRFILADNVLSPTFKGLREVLYSYHMRGLDKMSENPKDAKTEISNAIKQLETVHRKRPNSFLVRTFFDAKAEEIEDIFTGGPQVNVTNVISTLNKVAPMHASKWRNIRF